MLLMSDLKAGDIYMHDNRVVYAKLLRWQGDAESGGAVTIETIGLEHTIGLALFLRKYNVINVQELARDAYKNQG